MLKSISLCNFVHYCNPQRLEFENGANFIIGGNSSGKTVIFELIRRCLSNDISTTTTSIPHEGKLAYAVCHYEIPQNYPGPNSTMNLPPEISRVIACLFIEPDESQSGNIGRYISYKVFCIIGNQEDSHVYVQLFTGKYGCHTEDLENTVNKFHQTYPLKKFENIIARNCADFDEAIQGFFKAIKNNFTEDKDPSFARNVQNLFKWLEDGYVGLMSMRSIGPLQWTKSRFNKHDCRDRNYETACERAEILTYLLESTDIEKDKERQYHKILVHPYAFTKEDTMILVNNVGGSNTKPKPLLKTPDGIIEAKQLSLILSHKHYYTITLEEPDRGMHPHMIKKLRDLVLRNIEGKTILITSHNTTLIDEWAMKRTFVCSNTTIKTESGQVEINHHVNKVPLTDINYGRLEEMRIALFSPRILFVEGESDKRILEAVFRSIIHDTDVPPEFEISPKFKQYLLATEILELTGCGDGPKKKQFCDQLKKETILIYDFDVLTNHGFTPKQEGYTLFSGERIKINFEKELKVKKEIEMHLEELEQECNLSNVFIWKSGAIEKRIIEVLDSCKDENMINFIENLSTGKTKGNQLKKIKTDESLVKLYIKGEKDKENPIIKSLKKNIKTSDVDDIEILAQGLINHSPEIKRLIRFLQERGN